MLGPFELVGSFDMVGPFETSLPYLIRLGHLNRMAYLSSFILHVSTTCKPLKLNSSSCCIFHRCQTISNKNVQFNRTAQS